MSDLPPNRVLQRLTAEMMVANVPEYYSPPENKKCDCGDDAFIRVTDIPYCWNCYMDLPEEKK